MAVKIVVLDPIAPAVAEHLRALMPPGFVLSHGTSRDEAHLQHIIADADFAISGQMPVSAAVLGAARQLKLLHKWGVGTDNIDVEAARALGVRVARTTGSNAVAVAEFTIGLMLCALRSIAYGHASLLRGEWRAMTLPRPNYMLTGKTVGIIGFGHIGKAVARLISGFGCPILYNKQVRLDAAEEAALGVSFATIPELLAQADVVSLHCPLTPQTRGMIDARALASMKRTAVLVNVARGGVVIEDDLVRALQNGVIHAAATDVFETEPLPADSPLLTLDNLVVTPHIAPMAADNFEKTVRQMFGNIARVHRGEPVAPADVVV